MRSIREKISLALFAGLLVGAGSMLTRMMLSTEPHSRIFYLPDVVAGLIAVLVVLAVHLNYEGQYYRFALERSAVFSELNHHVRNAMFPLCLEVQRLGDAGSRKISDEAVERINMVLREAITDVFAGKRSHAA